MKRFFFYFAICFAFLMLSETALADHDWRQGVWRWRNDDGGLAAPPSGASWIAAENTSFTLTNTNNIRLRVELYNDDDGGSDYFSLFYRQGGSGSWIQISSSAGSRHFQLSTSTHVSNGTNITNRLLTQRSGYNDWDNGETVTSSTCLQQTDDTGDDDEATEWEWCIKATGNAVNGATYQFRVMQTNGGCNNENDLDGYGTTITLTYSSVSAPTLSTTAITAITQTTASSGGNTIDDGGAAITAKGVVWNTSTGPTTVTNLGSTSDGTGDADFSSSITGLSAGTLYYVRAYATNSVGTGYGNELTFKTRPTQATNIVVSNRTASSFQLNWTNGNGDRRAVFVAATNTGTAAPVDDVVYTANTAFGSGTQIGATGWYCVYDGTGTGPVTVTNVNPQTTEYRIMVCDYVNHNSNELYNTSSATGNPVSTITSPTLNTTAITAITQTTASSGGNTLLDFGSAITAKGVVWNTSTGPTTVTNLGSTSDGTGTSNFSSSITGLSSATVYYARAYATNGVGTSYGNELSFKTRPTQATNIVVSNRTASSFQLNWTNGNGDRRAVFVAATNTGTAAPVDDVVYTANTAFGSGTQIGATGWFCVYDGTGTGPVTVTNVNPQTTEYRIMVCDYVNHNSNELYNTSSATGNPVSTITSPSLNTTAISAITQTTASSGGNTLLDFGSAITAKGVVWATTTGPTTGTNLGSTSDGSGTADFSSSITGLSSATVYYARAYATNGVGTSYGNELSFKTRPDQASLITISGITVNSFDVAWTNGNGDGRAVFVKALPAGTASPVDNTTYTGNLSFGSGTEIAGTGWYAVYVGTGNGPITITNVTPFDVDYKVMVCEYVTHSGSTLYNTSTATNNPRITATTVYLSNDYTDEDDCWMTTCFPTWDAVLTTFPEGGPTVIVHNYVYPDDEEDRPAVLDITGFTVEVGNDDFTVYGSIIGGLIATPSTGRLIMNPGQTGGTSQYPLTCGEHNFSVQVIIDDEEAEVEIRLEDNPGIEGSITDFWEIIGPDGLNATVKFRVDKAAIAPKTLNSTNLIRYFDAEQNRYVPLPNENVTVVDMGLYYIITVTGVNKFN